MATLQSYDYEDVHPVIEKKNTPDSHLLIVQIPDGLFGLTLYYPLLFICSCVYLFFFGWINSILKFLSFFLSL
jgi:hypothetical protein